MTRKPLYPIIAGKFTIRATMNIQNKWQIRLDDLGRSISPDEVPAIIAAMTTLAREMGADVPDPVPVIEGLVDALNDAQSGLDYIHEVQGDLYGVGFERCELGSCSASDAARSYLEGRK